MWKGWKKVGLALVSLGLALVLVASACIPQVARAAPGERSVKVGLRALFTGPGADTGVPYFTGTIDAFKYMNEEQGGIDGVKVEVTWRDCKVSAAEGIVAHKAFVRQGVVIEEDIVSTISDVLAPRQQQDEIPLITASATQAMVTKPIPWVFMIHPGWCATFIDVVKWFKENWSDEKRSPRVGMIHYNDPAAWSAAEGAPEYVGKVGAEYVGSECVPLLGAIDTSVEWLRLAAKNPDLIWIIAYGATLVTLIKDAARLEIQQKGIKLCASAIAIDQQYLAILAKDVEGWYSQDPFAMLDEMPDLPLGKVIIGWAAKYRGLPLERVSSHYVLGWTQAFLMAEAISRAMEEVGFDNLTGRAVRDKLVTIRDFSPGGVITPITLTDEAPFILTKVRMIQVCQGKRVPISDPRPIECLVPGL